MARLKASRPIQSNTSFKPEQAQNILLLTKTEKRSDIQSFEQFLQALLNQNKSITLIEFSETAYFQDMLPDGKHLHLNNSSLNWLKLPGKKALGSIQSESFDLIIGFCEEDCFPAYYTGITTPAKFKIDSYNEEFAGYFDLMINSKNIDEKINILNQHLKAIQKH